MRAVLFLVVMLAVSIHATTVTPNDSLCKFNETHNEASTTAFSPESLVLNGDTWTLRFRAPTYYKEIGLNMPNDCMSGAEWACTEVSTADCNTTIDCTITGWVPANCGTVDTVNDVVSYTFTPNFRAWIYTDAGIDSIRTLNQSTSVQITYETLVNATLAFDSVGDITKDLYVSKAETSGLNDAAVLNLETTVVISYPWEYTIATNQWDLGANRGFALTPLWMAGSISCNQAEDSPCSKVLQMKIDNLVTLVPNNNEASACYIDGTYSVNLTRICRVGILDVDCPLIDRNNGPTETVTITARTSSVCITNSIYVTLGHDSFIYRDWDAAADTGTVQNAFSNGADVYFHTRFNVTNGQFFSSIAHRECYIDNTGPSQNVRLPYYASGAPLEGATEPAVTFRHSKVLKFQTNAVTWGIAAGDRRDLTVTCQYYVTLSGTDQGNFARRRLLQATSSAQQSSFTSRQFQVQASGSSGSGGAASSGSGALTVSPTVAAIAVLAVIAVVLVIVVVSKRDKKKQARENMHKADAEMVGNLGMTASSSQAALTPQETQV